MKTQTSAESLIPRQGLHKNPEVPGFWIMAICTGFGIVLAAAMLGLMMA